MKVQPYVVYRCMDCEQEFWVRKGVHKGKKNCPVCGFYDYVEKLGTFHVDRPFYYRKHWTDVEDEILVSGVMLGKLLKDIAQELDGRSVGAIGVRLKRLKRSGRFDVLSSVWCENKGN